MGAWKLGQSRLKLVLCLAVSTGAGRSLIAEESFSIALKDHRVRVLKSPTRPKLTLVYPKSVQESVANLETWTLEAFQAAESKLGLRQKNPAYVLFDFRPEFHNGLTTVVPNPRIFVHLEAPLLNSSVGVSQNYIRETLIHEIAHLIVMEQAEGVFGPLNHLVGTAARPLGAWPRWLHEGLAVWVEGVAGGRPHSGVLDLELRKFADFMRRKGRAPIRNSDLDGRLGLSAVSEGEIPYHIGYFLIDEWTRLQKPFSEDSAKLWADQLRVAAQSLGLSFRKSFDRNGVNWDTAWKSLETRARNVALEESLPADHVLDSGLEIVNPEVVGSRLGWIRGRQSKAALCSMESSLENSTEKPVSPKSCWTWGRRYSSPQSYWPLRDGNLGVVVYSSPEQQGWIHGQQLPENRVGLFNSKGRFICQMLGLGRVREVYVSTEARENGLGRLLWVQSRPTGHQVLFSRDFDERCQSLGEDQRVAQTSEPFERLSHPSLEQGQISWTQSLGPDLSSEQFNWSGMTRRQRGKTWSRFQRLPKSQVLVQEQSPEFWGPGVWDPDTGTFQKLSLPTGSLRTLWWESQGAFVVLESLWEQERLLLIPDAKFRSRLSQARPVDFVDFKTPGQKESPEVLARPVIEAPGNSSTEYRAWPSVLPHFWIPSLFVSSGQWSVLGQSFSDDLLGVWRAGLDLGYDSFLRSALGRFEISRSMAESPVHRLGGGASLSPTYNFLPFGDSRSQKRWSLFVESHSAWIWRSQNIRLSWNPQLSYQRAEASGFLGAYEFLVPSLHLGLSSLSFEDVFSGPTLLSQASAGMQWGLLSRWVKGPEYRARLALQGSSFGLGMRGEASGFWTDSANFPVSFAEWGGGATLNTFQTVELSRGFPDRSGVGLELVRAAFISAVRLTRQHRAFSWNRFRLGSADLRGVVESVSFTSLSKPTRFRLGKDWFTSVGGEFDQSFHLAHYVRGRLGLGLFHGLGEFGETRLLLSLRTGLDLP